MEIRGIAPEASLLIEPVQWETERDPSVECVIDVSAQGFTGHTFVWFWLSDVQRFSSELECLDQTRSGSVVLNSVGSLGESGGEGCSLTFTSLDRRGHIMLSVSITKRKYIGDGAALFDYHIAVGFEIDPSSLPQLNSDFKALFDGADDRA